MTLKPDSLKSVVFVFIQFASIALIVISGKSVPENIYCIISFAIFLSIGIWAIVIMKLNFNIAPDPLKNFTLVKSGPYKYIRHPMYTSVLGTAICFVCADFSIIRLFFWFILLTDLLLKLSYEEKLLRNLIPEYNSYSAVTKKIIPFVF